MESTSQILNDRWDVKYTTNLKKFNSELFKNFIVPDFKRTSEFIKAVNDKKVQWPSIYAVVYSTSINGYVLVIKSKNDREFEDKKKQFFIYMKVNKEAHKIGSRTSRYYGRSVKKHPEAYLLSDDDD